MQPVRLQSVLTLLLGLAAPWLPRLGIGPGALVWAQDAAGGGAQADAGGGAQADAGGGQADADGGDQDAADGNNTVWCHEDGSHPDGDNFTDNCTMPPPPCITEFCGSNIRREAYLACMDFQNIGTDEEVCRGWQDYAQTDCTDSCSDCRRIGLTIYGQCLFYLGLKMEYNDAMELCRTTQETFELNRCPAAILERKECETEEAQKCNDYCGNFYAVPALRVDGCDCWRDMAKPSRPTKCEGETVNTGLIAGTRGLEHHCRLMPQDCITYETGASCARYAYCPVDVCVVMNITCPYRGDCRSSGVCNTANGKCYYTARDDGAECSDWQDYTWGDTCMSGECVGNEDKCMRHEVDCTTLNPCLTPKMLMTYKNEYSNCDTGSGGCLFSPVQNGVACASVTGGKVDGACESGMCRRSAPDLCASRSTCPDLGMCYNTSDCDPYTGSCISRLMPDGWPCTDYKRSTFNDKCIEGRCVGSPFAEPTFQTMGSGDCVAHMPSLTECSGINCIREDYKPAPRYYKQAIDSAACQAQCAWDPECVAYSYGYHVCSIYGTKRTMHTQDGWLLDTTASEVEHEVQCWRKGEGEVWTFMRALRPHLHSMVVLFCAGTPALFVVVLLRHGIRASYRRSLGLQPSKSFVHSTGDEDLGFTDPSFQPGDVVRDGAYIEPNWDEAEASNEDLGMLPSPEGNLQLEADVAAENFASDTLSEARTLSPTRDPRGQVDVSMPDVVSPAHGTEVRQA